MTSEADLPFELYSKIFMHSLPANGVARPNPHESPLLLLQICRRWRTIALATSKLWDSLFMEYRHEPGYEAVSPFAVHSTAALMDLWLTRCNGHTLSLTLRSYKYPEWTAQLPRGLLDVLQNRFSRWKHLEIHLPWQDFLDLGNFNGSLSALRNLTILVIDGVVPSVFDCETSLCTKSPLLAILRFGNLFQSVPRRLLTSVAAASSNLTTLQLESFDPSCPLAVLDLFPRLRQLIFRYIGHRSEDVNNHAPKAVVARVLSSLYIEGYLGDMLQHISAPSLRHFGVNVYDEYSSHAAISFISRSRCTLHRLSLCASTQTISPTLLRLGEKVSRLDLLNFAFKAQATGAVWTLPLPHLPRLENLSLFSRDGSADVFNEIFRLLDAHRKSLWRVHIILQPISEGDHPAVLPEIEKLVNGLHHFVEDAGMRITLQTPHLQWPDEDAVELNMVDMQLSYNAFPPYEPVPWSIYQ
ncbi:hypothetical protein R3P38DRAFT_3374311 [Favolaschia claudopus]|uniref:F-box domain-containing protein n=1 Tax=Favolaschia claudopus TaxID=2862362 RepID=A0AAV9ZPE4_9AGAR